MDHVESTRKRVHVPHATLSCGTRIYVARPAARLTVHAHAADDRWSRGRRLVPQHIQLKWCTSLAKPSNPYGRLSSRKDSSLHYNTCRSDHCRMSSPTYIFPSLISTLQIRAGLKNAFRTGRTKSVQFRKQQLLALAYLVKDNLDHFHQALASDLGRSEMESIVYALTRAGVFLLCLK